MTLGKVWYAAAGLKRRSDSTRNSVIYMPQILAASQTLTVVQMIADDGHGHKG
jgi:hypothetical protein